MNSHLTQHAVIPRCRTSLHVALQDVAKAYSAACTPEFYVFDADMALTYHGQFDDSRPSKYGGDTPVTGGQVDAGVEWVGWGPTAGRQPRGAVTCRYMQSMSKQQQRLMREPCTTALCGSLSSLCAQARTCGTRWTVRWRGAPWSAR